MTSNSFISAATSLRSYVNVIWCLTSIVALGIANYYNDVASSTPPQIFMLLLLNCLSAHAVFLFSLAVKVFLGGEDSFGSSMRSELRSRFIALAGHKVYIFVTLLLAWKKTSFTLAYMVVMMFLSQLAHASKLKVDKLLQETERTDSRRHAIRLVTGLISLICLSSLVLGVLFWMNSTANLETEQVQRLSNFLSSNGGLHYRLLLCVDNLTVFIKMVNSILVLVLDSNNGNRSSIESVSPADIAAASDADKDSMFVINSFFPSCIDIVSLFHLLHVESLVGFNLSLFDLYIWLSLRAVGERLVDRYNKYKIYYDMKHTLDEKLSVYVPKKRKISVPQDENEVQTSEGLRRRGKVEESGRSEVDIDEEKECSICMENISNGRVCPVCKNVFHRHCLREFFVRKGELAWTCPLCVAVLRPARGIAQVVNNAPLPPPRQQPRQENGGVERVQAQDANPEVRAPPQPLLFNAMRGVFESFLGAHRVDENSEIGRNLLEMFPNSQRQALFDYASQYGVNATIDAVTNGIIPLNEEAIASANASNNDRDQTREDERIIGDSINAFYEETVIDSPLIGTAVTADAVLSTENSQEILREERRLQRLTAAEARLRQLR